MTLARRITDLRERLERERDDASPVKGIAVGVLISMALWGLLAGLWWVFR